MCFNQSWEQTKQIINNAEDTITLNSFFLLSRIRVFKIESRKLSDIISQEWGEINYVKEIDIESNKLKQLPFE